MDIIRKGVPDKRQVFRGDTFPPFRRNGQLRSRAGKRPYRIFRNLRPGIFRARKKTLIRRNRLRIRRGRTDRNIARIEARRLRIRKNGGEFRRTSPFFGNVSDYERKKQICQDE